MEDASARLLPLPSYQSSKSLKPSVVLVASLVLIITPITTIVSIYGYNFWMGVDKPLAPQWADAIQAAELAAENLCSGHGNVFVDSVAMNADGTPACECNNCFTGSDCSISVVDCVADADSGNPLLFEPYWRENADLGTVVIPGWYRMGYLAQDGRQEFYTDALMAAIRGLHATVGNAVTENRYIVVGTGSVQLINAVVHGLALQDAGRVSSVVAKTPFYGLYQAQTEYFESPLYTFAGEPSRVTGNPKGRGLEIELIASPNNPTGQMQEVPENVSGPVVYDHAYYWPHLTPITKAQDSDIMLFTLSKVTGHAGSRVGWAIIKDLDLYTKVSRHVLFNTLGMSHEAQLRATQLIRAITNSYSKGNPPGKQGIFHFGYEVLKSRWARLEAIFQNSSRFSLQEMKPGYCNFFKQVSDPSPGYAWIHCNDEKDVNCTAVMLYAGVTGRPGSESGASDRYVRLSLLKLNSDFDILAAHLAKLVESET